MAKSKRIIISDIHLSSQKLYDNGQSWFKPSEGHDKRLINYIDNEIIAKHETIKDVVLLGDIFNTWVCPANVKPPTYKQIFSAQSNKRIIRKFEEIVKAGINLFYINGNHDFDLSSSEVKEAIKGIKPAKIYKSGLLHAEHGHRFDEIFNQKDFYSDPTYGRPIGYIISRLVTSIEQITGNSGYGILDMPTYLDDLAEAALPGQNIFESIIEGLSERADMDDDSEILMPHNKKMSIRKTKEKYSVLSNKYNTWQFIRQLWERSRLGSHADRICTREDVDIVIFGHSHKATIDKDFLFVKDRIYANSGSWCKKNAYCVEVDKTQNNGASVTEVMLHKIDPLGAIKNTKRESISYS